MNRYTSLINFIGSSQNISYESSIEIICVHSLNNLEDAQQAFFLIHEEIKNHFSRFEILSIELL